MTIFMPERVFVGGSTETFSHTLNADLTGYSVTFTLTRSLTILNGSPSVSKAASVSVTNMRNIRSTVSATLDEGDTEKLYGRYTYQMIAKKDGAETYVFQGLCSIVANGAK